MPVLSRPNLIAIRANDPYSACVDYVIGVFARYAGMDFTCTTPEAAEKTISEMGEPRLLLIYGSHAPNEEGIHTRLDGKFEYALSVRRSDFFTPQHYLKKPDLPVPAETLIKAATSSGFRSRCHFSQPGTVFVSVDIVASAFWFLTRYEEYLATKSDEHGRFLCAHSIAPAAMYDLPLVNRWFVELAALAWEGINCKSPIAESGERATIALTHDVDLLRKYRGLRGVRRMLSNVIGNPQIGANETRNATLVMAGLRRDPYDSFDDLFALKERIGAQSTFFLMGGGNAPLDGDYDTNDPYLRELLIRIRGFQDEIGIHPSFESYLSEATMRSEKSNIEKYTGTAIHGSRQHYLRFKTPQTWRALCSAGIRYDSSMAFADRAGFRCGWSGCFHPFDIETQKVMPLIEIPLTLMDVTLANYEKVSAEHSLERLASLLDSSAVHAGAFVLLWHNILRDAGAFPGFWDAFEYFIFAAAGSARFVTLSRLCDEFDSDL